MAHFTKAAVAALTLSLTPIAASADTIDVYFYGAVQSLTDFGDGILQTTSVGIGDYVQGMLTYVTGETATAFTDPHDSDGTLSFYSASLQSMTLSIGSFDWSGTGGGATVSDDYMHGSAADNRESVLFNIGSITGDSVDGATATGFQVAFGDDDQFSLLSSSALPGLSEMETLAYNTTIDGNWNILSLDNGDQIRFDIYETYVEAAPAVPLPAALPMLLAGLGAFGAIRRRKKA